MAENRYCDIEAFLDTIPQYAGESGVVRAGALLEELGHPEKTLKIFHVAGSNGKSRYAILEEHTPDMLSDNNSRVLKDAVISLNIGQNIVVVKTIPGMAMAAAAALDAMKWPEILGCIAGDDAIMCVVKTSEQAPGVVQKLGGIYSRGK